MERFWLDADFCSVVDVSEITRWESAIFHGNRKWGRFGRKDGNVEESLGCGYRGILCDRAERWEELGGWDVY